MELGTALITGSSRGIGFAIAKRVSELGYKVALTARGSEQLGLAVAKIPAASGRAMMIMGDLRDPDAPTTLVRHVTEELGPIDLLINNAGTAPSDKIENTTDITLDEVLDLHVRAPFRLIRDVIPQMKERGKGCVIQLASTAGLRGFALITAYTAAKHAMVGLTRALAVELARTPIRAYAVCPGFVDTEITREGAAKVAAKGKHSVDEVMAMYGAMNASGRLLTTDEVADVVAQLAAPGCTEPSGSIYDMDDMPPTVIK